MFPISALLILSPLLPLYLYFRGNWYSILHDYSLGMVFGIFAYIYLLNSLMLSGRVRLFDKIAGHDRIMKIHIVMSCAGLFLSVIHLFFKRAYIEGTDLQIVLGVLAIMLFMLASFLAAFGMGAISLFGKRVFIVKTDYTKLKLLHNIAALAAFVVTIHVFLSDSTSETQTRRLYMLVYASVALLVYLQLKILRPVYSISKMWKISDLKPVAPGISEITIANSKGYTLNFIPGQFAYFNFLMNGMREEHPFTISSPPSSRELIIRVKSLGDYTSRIGELKVGTRVIIDGPYGKFVPASNKAPLLFFAGGIGITPFISMISHFANTSFFTSVTLLWSCKNETDFFMTDFLSQLAKREPLFKYIPFVSTKNRISKESIISILNNTDTKALNAYVCGPDNLRYLVQTTLRNYGIANERIHYERFI